MAKAVVIYHFVQMMKNVTCLPVLALVHYPVTTYQGHFVELVAKINVFMEEKLRMELKCHRFDVTEVDVFSLFYHQKKMDVRYRNRLSVMFKTA